ncbi:MAG TPA: HisA/HisF-related TIM barrel protein [Solirubrobacteraceae bacterium]|nr:HisA/HisF-related TIM barrel protein [Solirubrobacteraceae bacterium]
MSVAFCGLELAHPIINGSGTFDAFAAREAFGAGLLDDFPFAAYVSKTITLAPRAGNPPPRVWEVPAGMINSIGLPNKGLAGYLEDELPRLAGITTRGHDPGGELRDVPLVTNVMGSTATELRELVEACERRVEIAAVELNVSCPNVETGLDIGADPDQLRAVVGELRDATAKPLIVKLTPNAADVPACALAAEQGGADAVSLINTLRAMALAPSSNGTAARPWLGGTTGGLSGPAVRAVALAQVAAVAERVGIPVIGMGGVQTGAHARELLEVGASLVAVGTESFRDPAAGRRIARELQAQRTAV